MSKADDHGKVAALAEDLLGSVQWSDAIEAADSPRIFPVGKIFHYLLLIEILAFVISNAFAVNKDSGAMEGYIAPYNEYYMVILSQPDHNILS